MSTVTTPSADEIQRQMRDVRAELREDVQEIVDNAKVMTEWQYYVRRYPWLCLGAAAALGYLIVPPRIHVVKPDPKALADLVRQRQVAVKAEVSPRPAPGLLGGLVNMAAGAALQGVLAIASAQLHQFLQGLSTSGTGARGGQSHEKSHR